MKPSHEVVSHAEWVKKRRALLAKEKEFTRLRDELSAERRALPWERVEKTYRFEGPKGHETLSDLFDGRSQLVVYHFMFGVDANVGCKGCSFWADNFNGIVTHLAHRDTTLVAVSHAPLAKFQPFAKRMGWTFKWVSAYETDFNFDYHVSFRPEDVKAKRAEYNYTPFDSADPERPGVSVFFKDESGSVFHTYSAYARGIDMLNTAYNYLDLTPKGRDEDALPHPFAWLRFHDEYAA